ATVLDPSGPGATADLSTALVAVDEALVSFATDGSGPISTIADEPAGDLGATLLDLEPCASSGAVRVHVDSGEAADVAGLRLGDLIVAVDGEDPRGAERLGRRIAA